MHIEDFIEAAKTYDELGWAVQSQIDDLLILQLNPGTLEKDDLNKNAVSMIEDWVNRLPYGIDTGDLEEAITAYGDLEHEEEEVYV